MKLTPLEIRKMDFSKSLRGYNPDEVRAFLDIVAEQLEALQREVTELSDRVVRAETRLTDYQSMEKTLQDTLMRAEESSQRSRGDAQREGEIIVREAQVEAQQVRAEARNYADRLQAEILLLHSRREAFIKKLKYLLQSQQDLIEILEKNDFEEGSRTTGSLHENHTRTVS